MPQPTSYWCAQLNVASIEGDLGVGFVTINLYLVNRFWSIILSNGLKARGGCYYLEHAMIETILLRLNLSCDNIGVLLSVESHHGVCGRVAVYCIEVGALGSGCRVFYSSLHRKHVSV